MKIVLVSCVKRKQEIPMPARDLYVSPWFRLARAYAQRFGKDWYILSAQYHLLPPAWIVPPYERTLKAMPAWERREWAYEVYRILTGMRLRDPEFVVLAGRRYTQYLVPKLQRLGTVELPLAGLGIGQQMAWLKARLGEEP